MPKYRIAWLPGDGVGVDVLEAAEIVLRKLAIDASYLHAGPFAGTTIGRGADTLAANVRQPYCEGARMNPLPASNKTAAESLLTNQRIVISRTSGGRHL